MSLGFEVSTLVALSEVNRSIHSGREVTAVKRVAGRRLEARLQARTTMFGLLASSLC
jgi:hypothetical protein